MRYLLWTALGIAALAVAAVVYLNRQSAADEGDLFEHVRVERLADDYWNQGEAEVNLYRAGLVKYGRLRPTNDVAHILVTERHDPERLVKADDWRRPGLLDVLKFNLLVQVQTGAYPYRQMASAFFDRNRGRLVKLTFSSQEWCGTSFKELVNFRGESRFHFNTYWDGQGRGERPVDFPPDTVFYDSLPAQLRLLDFDAGGTLTFPLAPSQFSSRAEPPVLERARLTVEGREAVTVPWGESGAVRLRLESGGGTDLLWFEADFPHRLLKWETRGGDRFELRRSRKTAYWTLNRPQDEPFFAW